MADPERIAESKRRYDRRKPTVAIRLPDLDVLGEVVSASTAKGQTRVAWIRDAIAEKLERERKD